jgi:hypothetical protein
VAIAAASTTAHPVDYAWAQAMASGILRCAYHLAKPHLEAATRSDLTRIRDVAGATRLAIPALTDAESRAAPAVHDRRSDDRDRS